VWMCSSGEASAASAVVLTAENSITNASNKDKMERLFLCVIDPP